MSGSDTVQPGHNTWLSTPTVSRENLKFERLHRLAASLSVFWAHRAILLPPVIATLAQASLPTLVASLFSDSATCLACLPQRDLPISVRALQSWQKPAFLRALRHRFLVALRRRSLSVPVSFIKIQLLGLKADLPWPGYDSSLDHHVCFGFQLIEISRPSAVTHKRKWPQKNSFIVDNPRSRRRGNQAFHVALQPS